MGVVKSGGKRLAKIFLCSIPIQIFNSSRDMATRTTTNYSGLPRRRGGVAASKPVAGVKMASKAGSKPVTVNRAPLNTQNGGKTAATTDTNNKKQLRTTKTAARRLLKSPISSNDEIDSMDLDSLDIISYKDEIEKRYKDRRPALPKGVNNIDTDENPQLCAEYAQDMYVYLKQKETRYTVPTNYLCNTRTTAKMRTVLLDWLVDVQQQFKLLQETLYLTISIIDRFLHKEGAKISRDKLQLVGVTAMLIASKIEEIYAPEVNDFVYITDDAYTANDIKQMELRILKAIKCDLGDPLPINFLRRFSKAGDVDVNQHALAKYVLEIIMLDYSMVGVSGSLAAASSLWLTFYLLEEEFDEDVEWTASLQYYTGYKLQDVVDMSERAMKSLQKMHSGQFTAIKNKFSTKSMLEIANNSTLLAKLNRTPA